VEADDLILLDVTAYKKSMHILPYDHPLSPSLFLLSDNHPHSKTRPFRQRIQLSGPSKYSVRATAQVDNGAMRNCIGLHIWKSYGHCLGELTPTKTKISVANNQRIVCVGQWTGEVYLGGTKSVTHFLVFDYRGAFDVILGKPWLHEVCTIHDYATDTIIINTDTSTVFIDNAENNPPLADTEPDHLDENSTTEFNTTPQSLDELIDAEVHRIETLQQSHGAFTESRWASYLDIDPMEEDTDTTSIQTPGAIEWFTTAAEQRAIKRAKNRERRMDKQKRRTEILTWLSEESRRVKEERTTTPHMEVVESAVLRKRKETETYANTWRNR
jgi:hypothetical protein